MKKFALLATAVLGMALSVQAAPATTVTTTTTVTSNKPSNQPLPLGLNAVGYDANLGHITARLGLSQNNAIDLGVGLNFQSAPPGADENLQLGLSGFYLLKLQDWGMVDNYLAAGGVFSLLPNGDPGLTLFGGLQPEVTLMDRIIISVRFGLNVPIMPDFALQTAGSPISVVQGFNFKIIW